MTIMRVTLVGTQLDADAKRELSLRLIDSFSIVEVGESTPAMRAGFVVQIEEADPANVWNGDSPMTESGSSGSAALIDVRVMAGPWNAAMKAELFERLEVIVRDVADMPKEGGGADFWMTIVEVPEGAWGVGGRPVSIADIAPVFGEDRQQRIRQHLEKEKT